MTDLPHGTVTFLFTDIEGSTALLRRLGERYTQVLDDHLRLLRTAVADHDGREIDTQGDALFAVFSRATDAVNAAAQAQRALDAHEWPDSGRPHVRMGVHTGEQAADRERVVGLGVHRAARICAAGHGDQVLVSDTTHGLLGDTPPTGVTFKDLGRRRLKDFEEPQHIFQLVAPGLRREFPQIRTPAAARRRLIAIVGGTIATVAAIAAIVAALDGSGPAKAFVVDADAVGVIDPASDRAEQVEVGASPSHVLATPGAVWVSNADGHSVSQIDAAKRDVRQTIPVGSGPAGLAYADGAVWVANALDATVNRIDPTSSSVVERIPVGQHPTAVAAAGGAVWVANSGEQTLSRIDPVTGRAVSVNVGATPTDLLAADGFLWMSSRESGTVFQLDPRSGKVEGEIVTGGSPSALAAGAGALWVANPLDGTVSRIDPATAREVAKILVGNGPEGIAAGPDAVWVDEQYGGTLDEIDPHRNQVINRRLVGNRPTGLALIDGHLWIAVRESGAAHRGGSLVVATDRDVDSLDPQATADTLTVPILQMTLDGLTAYQHVGGAAGAQVVPDLAQYLPRPTDGGRTYRFVLRRGIRYSTGATVRPEDVRATFERMFKLNASGGFFARLVGSEQCVRRPKTCDLSRGVAVDTGHDSVTFHLTSPDPDFYEKLAAWFTAVLPADTPARSFRRRPLPTTGPYMIAGYRPGQTLRLVRNPRFHEWSQAAQPDGYPDSIVVRMNLTANEAVDAVEHGRADAFGGARDLIPKRRVHELLTRYAGRTQSNPVPAVMFMFLNTRVPPFDDVRVRRALSYAVDRRAAVRAFGRGGAQPTCQVLPPNFPGYEPYCPYHAPRLRMARRLVGASGTRGMPVVVWANPFLAPGARSVIPVLRRLGYRTRLKVVPIGRYFPAIADSRNRIQIGVGVFAADFPAASDFLATLLSCDAFIPRSESSANPSEFCDPRSDALMRRATAAQPANPERANRIWAAVDRRMVDAAPLLPLVTPRSIEVLSSRVGNYQYNPQYGSLIDQLWVR